jgi:hypothetical protein
MDEKIVIMNAMKWTNCYVCESWANTFGQPGMSLYSDLQIPSQNQNLFPARTQNIRWYMQQDLQWYHVQTDTAELNWQPKPSQQSFTYSRSRFLNSLNTPGPNFSILLKCRYLGGEHTNSDINTRLAISASHISISNSRHKSEATPISVSK